MPADREPTQTGKVLSEKKTYHCPKLIEYGTVRALTGSVSGAGPGDGSLMMNFSEPSLKTNICRIGEHPAGFGLYLFDYKPEYRNALGHGRRLGVMADEVQAVVPEAVTLHPVGYRQVNYTMLGIARAGR